VCVLCVCVCVCVCVGRRGEGACTCITKELAGPLTRKDLNDLVCAHTNTNHTHIQKHIQAILIHPSESPSPPGTQPPVAYNQYHSCQAPLTTPTYNGATCTCMLYHVTGHTTMELCVCCIMQLQWSYVHAISRILYQAYSTYCSRAIHILCHKTIGLLA